jgi:response regulator of citrate/malate metabolism
LLTNDQVKEFLNLLANGKSLRKTARLTGISRQTIRKYISLSLGSVSSNTADSLFLCLYGKVYQRYCKVRQEVERQISAGTRTPPK